jgi:hypothetical protein
VETYCYWFVIKQFFNSVFFTSIAGSLAGAFAGAYGANWIVERTKYREQLVKEIRDTNAAISLAHNVCNSLLLMKKQHIKPLKEKLDEDKARLQAHLKQFLHGQISETTPCHFFIDLETLSPSLLPVDFLHKQVFEKLSLVGRPLTLVPELTKAVHNLSECLEKRNQLIENYKISDISSELRLRLYLGLPQANGEINNEYPHLINAIYGYTEDSIFFSQLLCKDLIEHGNQIAGQFRKKFKKGAPRVSEVNFDIANELGLMPNTDEYAVWLKMA